MGQDASGGDLVLGSYAYWVGDEGVKARFDVDVEDNSAIETWASAGRLAAPIGTGIHKVTGMEDYIQYLPGGSEAGDMLKFLSHKTMDLSEIDRNIIRTNFHNITTSHVGLLVDNRWGGIRRDLSTAFEIGIEEFGEIEEFNNSGERNLTGRYSAFAQATNDVETNPLYYSDNTDSELGYLYEVPTDSDNRYRGPTWDVLRNHYRLYKKERNNLNFRGTTSPSSDALMAHGLVPFSYNGDPNDWQNSSLGSRYNPTHWTVSGGSNQIPFTGPHGVGGGYPNIDRASRTQPTVQKIAPQMLRAVFAYGVVREDDTIFITVDPYFVIHNPYNHPLEFWSIGFDISGLDLLANIRMAYTNADDQADVVNFKAQATTGASISNTQGFRLTPLVGDANYRLEPGEIKLVSAVSSMGGKQKVTLEDTEAVSLTEMQYNDGAGVYLNSPETAEEIEVKPGSNLEFTVTTNQPGNTRAPMSLYMRLLHPLAARGGDFDIDDVSSYGAFVSNLNKNNDGELVSLIQRINVSPKNETVIPDPNVTGSTPLVFAENQIPSPSAGTQYLYVMDIRMKGFDSGVAPISDFNYRALASDPRDYHSSFIVSPSWEFEVRQSDLFDLGLADANGNGFWGEGNSLSSGGESKIVLFDLPRAPLASLGSLQHADTSKLHYHASHSIANSRIAVGISDQTQIFNDRPGAGLSGSRSTTEPKIQIDTSWAANEALWDRFCFTGMNWGIESGQIYSTHTDAATAVVNGDLHQALVNPRMTLVEKPSSADLDSVMEYTKIGEFLGIKGAFNVNSTSVEAWKAVLSSLSGREISYLASSGLQTIPADSSQTPLSRFSTPAGDSNDDYNGFRALDDEELNLLAEAIVDEVKARGPFMGLADFVNRRLVDDETGQMGALQAAIDKSEINDDVSKGSTNPGTSVGQSGLEQSAPDVNAGMATHLNQGDILTAMGSIIATRSDTFTIRAYGDSKDVNGSIIARAWCEAVVQRSPEWLEDTAVPATVQKSGYPTDNPTDEPILRQWEPNPDLPVANQNFGRKFKIESFRWLSAQEV